jgi:hypothetical protein
MYPVVCHLRPSLAHLGVIPYASLVQHIHIAKASFGIRSKFCILKV